MKKLMKFFYFSALVVFFINNLNQLAYGENSVMKELQLWPEIKPAQTGYLQVSDIHQIYYEVMGNPKGKPVFILHGGPGGECTPRMRRWADPKRFFIVLHDQRGAGKSQPLCETRENTTQHLVRDIETLRKKLKVDQVILVGGSWGTTLAITYAETYPQNVSGLVLCGVFTGTKSEIDHIFHGGVAPFFPKVYQNFIDSLPDPNIRPLPAYLYQLLHKGNENTKRKISIAWGRYTIRISMLEIPEKKVEKILNSWDPFPNALFESYYMAHNAFLEEGQLLGNAHRIAHIPAIIINGRYDFICPLKTAYKLNQVLPKSKLVIVERAGHSSKSTLEKEILKAVNQF
jgi:proline iminopeptidase